MTSTDKIDSIVELHKEDEHEEISNYKNVSTTTEEKPQIKEINFKKEINEDQSLPNIESAV